uniref:Uncharacterized protein n=1 Tax=Anguilla anguilla TaxID=7936 RepID=A0A0E9S9K1_ANGAN
MAFSNRVFWHFAYLCNTEVSSASPLGLCVCYMYVCVCARFLSSHSSLGPPHTNLLMLYINQSLYIYIYQFL